MGDHLWAGIPSRYALTSQLGQFSLASRFQGR